MKEYAVEVSTAVGDRSLGGSESGNRDNCPSRAAVRFPRW
jgi:hypothetical protein